jgi:uncharacterized protein YeaO (DUF488 family)
MRTGAVSLGIQLSPRAKRSIVQKLRDQALEHRLTLLYGARDPRFNHAVVLRDAIRAGLRIRTPKLL